MVVERYTQFASLFIVVDVSIMYLDLVIRNREPPGLLNRSIIYQIHGFIILAPRCESGLRTFVRH